MERAALSVAFGRHRALAGTLYFLDIQGRPVYIVLLDLRTSQRHLSIRPAWRFYFIVFNIILNPVIDEESFINIKTLLRMPLNLENRAVSFISQIHDLLERALKECTAVLRSEKMKN